MKLTMRWAGQILIFAALPVLVACTGAPLNSARPLAGHWTASVALSESESVTLIVDLGQFTDGLSGEFDTPEFDFENYPVTADMDESGVVRMVFSGPEAEFTGRLAENGTVLAGTIVFGEESYGVRLQRDGEGQFSPLFLELESAAGDSTRVTPLSADFGALRTAFNGAVDRARLVLLLSPT